MIRTLKIIGLLLGYPTATVREHIPEMKAALLDENLLPGRRQDRLVRFIEAYADADLLDLQEAYVGLFDRGRAHSLHLFEHIHGESRMRGAAMLDLRSMYESNGYMMSAAELPDYLPVLLEYLSMQDMSVARSMLKEIAPILAALRRKLAGQPGDYDVLMAALEDIAGLRVPDGQVEKVMQVTGEATDDLEALDKEWEDPEAFGGDPAADCGTCHEPLHGTHRQGRQ